MDFKLKSLYDKIYRNYIRGKYGDPEIPTKDKVLSKISEITTLDPVPITKKLQLEDIDIDSITNQFANIIDDSDVLFDAVENESRAILDQLTNSIKEQNGVKRELKRINSRADDLSIGKVGEDYINYNFTETFNSLTNINSLKSDQVDLDAGQFTIKRNSSKALSLNHYKGTKLEFSVVQNLARLEDYGYTGSTDAGIILDPNDDRSLTYRLKTNRSTPIKVATSIQLESSGKYIEINGLTLNLDTRINKGQIRLYYRADDAAWHDVTPVSVQDIKGDRVHFNFDAILTSHIKLEFIKDIPDIPATNEFFITIQSLSIYKATTINESTLISKPVVINSYSNEHPVVESLRASMDIDLPPGSNYNLYVARDTKISGSFKDSQGNVVDASSPNISYFDSSYADHVFLSDLHNVPSTVSGTAIYKGLDYDWLELVDYKSEGSAKNKVVSFDISSPLDKITNSLYADGGPKYLFGDSRFDGPWPTGVGVWYLSGWCNEDNANWSGYLSGMVGSGILVSGANIATAVGVAYADIEDSNGNLHPDISGHPGYSGQWLGYGSGVGYPFGYYSVSDGRIIRFGEFNNSIDGWWRPAVNAVTTSGLNPAYVDEDNRLLELYQSIIPDFHFNGINFWKIYKFGTDHSIVNPSVKIYTYQERPTFGKDRYYPHTFKWKYRVSWENKKGTKIGLSDSSPPDGTFEGYHLDISDLFSNTEEYLFGGISEIRVHNTNVVLTEEDYALSPATGTPTTIDLSLLEVNRPSIVPEGASFDITYNYKVKNRYDSTWTSYAIVPSSAKDPTIVIPNIPIYGKENIPIIKYIEVENLDTSNIKKVELTDDSFIVKFDTSTTDKANKHYRITIFCASDEDTGFCAKYNRQYNWVPYTAYDKKSITVSNGIKLVSELSPLKIVDLGSLIYDSAISNSRKCALYTDLDNKKYLVVRQPSKDIFPGYYYDQIKKQYETYYDSRIENRGHWIRKGYDNDLVNELTYTTGSSGSVPGKVYITEYQAQNNIVDATWNNGTCLTDYPNTSGDRYYPVHSTYGFPVNIEEEEYYSYNRIIYDGDIDLRAPTIEQAYVGSPNHTGWLQTTYPDNYSSYLINKSLTGHGYYNPRTSILNRGFLYYNTAENLPTYYSIGYKVLHNEEDYNSRFLYKLALQSESDSNVVPIVRSVHFSINEE